jgi:DNA repair photolyase
MSMKRGAVTNMPNPFERLHVVEDPEAIAAMRMSDPEWEPPQIKTQFFVDDTQSLLTKNDSPDLSFDVSLNPYRGCEHGCAYCYARRYHEFLGFSAGLDFESKIMVKPKAPALLRDELSRKTWIPQKLALSGVTDCYQPVERRLEITRGCLQVLAEFRNPVVVITKNFMVTRDVEPLTELARWKAGAVILSITSLDAELSRVLEPRASSPSMRLRAIRFLADAGIPVGVSLAPIIPGLNDMELASILESARDAGAMYATYSVVRLPGSGAAVFQDWLDQNVSVEKKESVLRRIEASHGGGLNSAIPFERMRGQGAWAEQIGQLFKVVARKLGLDRMRPELSADFFRRPERSQMELPF